MSKRTPDNGPRRKNKQVTQGDAVSRREFVRKGSILVVATVSCTSEGTRPTAHGTFHLTLTGLNGASPNGGTASATSAEGDSITVVIPAAGDQSVVVPVGTYSVGYAPPANHTLAPGTVVPPTVTIEEDETTTVELALEQRGTIAVAVTGLSGTTGGSALATRVDVPGSQISIPLSASGTGTVGVPVGTYTVAYTAPAGFAVTSANPLSDVSVGFGATAPAAFTVSGAPAATGTIQISVTGLSGSNGGSAVVQRTDASANPVTVTLSASGSGSASVPVGTYRVSYAPPTGFNVTSTNPITGLVVTDGASVAAAFSVAAVSPTTGTIQVTVTGLSGASGGSAVAQRTDAAGNPINIAISAAGSGTASNVPAGTYTVTYTTPPGFTVSSTNPLTGLVVSAGATTAAPFSVAAVAAGAVLVTVTGLTGATSGGSLSARLTDNTGNTFTATLGAPASGTTEGTLTGLPPGSYNVTYLPPTGFRVAAGQSNPRVVAVTSGATANTTFVAEQNLGGEAVVSSLAFFSDWRTALGTTLSALSDGGKWNDLNFDETDDRMEVISATGHGFPAAINRVLRIHCRDTDGEYSAVERTPGAWALPPIGGAILFRVYFRHSFIAPGSDKDFHPYQPTAGACANESNTRFRGTSPTFVLRNWASHMWEVTLNQDTVYRYEERYVRVSANTWRISCRIADAAENIVRQNSDFSCVLHGGAHTLASGTQTDQVSDTCIVRRQINWQGGNGAGSGNDDDNANQMKWGAFAVASVDASEADRWIGPYPHPNED